ncbi:MAG: chemotaxis protein CheA [Planctomycetes bacterium]|nr:chemotaxis protein CheA [Planctomycetota bacterium]
MSIPGIQSLGPLVDRVRSEGGQATGDLVREMRTVGESARASSLDDLARLCRVAAETIEGLASSGAFDEHADLVLTHLTNLVEFASKCDAMLTVGGDPSTLVPPSLLVLQDADERRHFAETLAMFLSQAVGSMQELEEEILSLETVDKPEETVAGIRRSMHTLKAEFGVLNMNGPQKLCHQAETTIDACTEHGVPFPVDLMLQVVDQLKTHLEALSRDTKASFGDITALLDRLRAVAEQACGGSAGQELVKLTVGGEFADSLTEFVTEARAHLTDAEGAMVALSSDPEDLESVNLTFRAFHTIKGVGGFLNLTPLVELAHAAETLLDGARSHRLTFGTMEIDLVLAAGDMIQQMINSLEGAPGPSQREWKLLISRLVAAAAGGTVRQHAVEVPSAAPRHEAPPAPSSPPPVAPAAVAPPVQEPPAIPPKPAPKPAPAANQRPPAATPKSAPAPAAPATEGDGKGPRVERTIKVSTTRLDMLVDMVGELVIAQSMVLQDPAIQRLDSQSLARNIGQVGKITRDLQEAAMSLRMVTVKATFQKMARLVRDVAGKSGKKVALVIEGEETELDRNVVEQISDPLVHMIRNAIDHGIEAPDDRRSKGKDAEGSLSLSAYHQGGSIVIEIRDDGRGLDRQKLISKALEKGVLPPDTNPQAMSDAEVYNLIFLPGFSTAEKVTDLSGRGVGMDVVRRNIEALRGKIEIDSRPGEGTTFRMRLPLTLAIIDGMVVRVGSNRFVLPTLSIEQSFRPSADDVHHLVDRGECVHVRGAVLPVYRLKDIFAQGDGLDDLAEGILIVVEVDGMRSCLFVDEILGQQQVVIKSLGMPRERVTGLSGGAIMTDGRVALIVDVGTLIESALSA